MSDDAPKPRGFLCPTCGLKLQTISTRSRASGIVTRRRVCRSCNHRITTTERAAVKPAR